MRERSLSCAALSRTLGRTLSSAAKPNTAHALEGTRRNTLIAQGLVAVHPSCAATATSPSPAAGALAGAAVYCCRLTSCDGSIKQRDEDGGSGCAEALWSTHTR